MANPRRFELDDLLIRPGTYFNPQTEVILIVDDSSELDSEIFNMEEFEGAEWVLISDELPVEEHVRDELLERFQARHHPGASGAIAATEDDEDEVDELDADEDEDVEEL
jgi:hypothetical protein